MSSLSAPQAPRKRRRYTKVFKASIINACQQPGASVSRVTLDHGLNANLVRRWIRKLPRQVDRSKLEIFRFSVA